MNKKVYTSPELLTERLQELDVITASGDAVIPAGAEIDNGYFSIMNLFN